MSEGLETTDINDTDMSKLCSYMYLAVVQKYMYDCYQVQEIGVFTPKEWLQWQLSRGRLAILSDVVEGMNPTEFEQNIRDNFPSFFEGQRGAYDSFPEEMKEQIKGMIVTYDNVYIAKLRLWDWLFNTNFIVRFLGLNSFIEINLISDVSLVPKEINILKLHIKIQTKAMSKKGEGEIAELRFNVKNGKVGNDVERDRTLNNVMFEEIIFMHTPLGSYTEKKMDDSNRSDIIEFMQKFIANQDKERREGMSRG